MLKIVPTLFVLPLLVVAGCSEENNDQSRMQSEAKTEIRQTVEYPDQPVKGVVNGRPMLADRAQLKDGTMTIRQGDEFFATRQLQIFLFDKESMSGRKVNKKGTKGFSPHVHVSWQDEGWNLPKTEVVSSGYDLSLKFGKETEYGLPYSIRFSTDKIKNTHVTGSGFATFKEIKVKNGKLDRSFNSFDTLEYIVKNYLEEKNGKGVDIVNRFAGRYSGHSDDNKGKGYLGVEYQMGDKDVYLARLQLQKDTTGWQVVNQLADTELNAAHPLLDQPDNGPQARSASYMKQEAARYIEDEYNKKGLIPYFRKTDMDCQMVKGYEEGNCEFSFQIKMPESEDCEIRNFHLKYDGVWSITEELELGYQYDFTSGKLVKDKYPSRLCRKQPQQS